MQGEEYGVADGDRSRDKKRRRTTDSHTDGQIERKTDK